MHHHKLRPVAAAQVMNGMRSEFFACAALAFDQHVGRGGRHLFNGIEDFVQRGRVAPDIFQPVTFVHLLPQRAVFLFQFAALYRARDQQFDLVEVERFGHKIVSAAFHRFDCDIDRAVRCHHDADWGA